ncbi:hypothetical protein [Streptomyces sp. 8L]|uniref:hypothetical protein n=1 Tax=Streptomyces sp. 8L TaxID=2877242 RepID=UPI001CD21C80|nr:hypothetical protein [Streptomyces sp. 8L]MCA1218708.1 hypothetical protein [Streptomyces sp. 8L]
MPRQLRQLPPDVTTLAREVADLRRQVRELRASRRLEHSSISQGALTITDPDGTVRAILGHQDDGSVALVSVGGPPPGAPSPPVVTPSLGGLSVVWDGTLADGSTLPADFDHVAVHVSTSSGFTPSAATFAGTITRAGEGGRLPVVPLPYQTTYVRLVGVNTGGIDGPASAQTAGVPAQVDGPDLTAGSVTAVAIAAGAVTADKLEAILALVTRLVAGDPTGARVELNGDGLRVYNNTGALTVSFDGASGNAAFTGTITGSDISGGTITGTLVQTGTGAQRVVLNPGTSGGQPPSLDIYTGATGEATPGRVIAAFGGDGAEVILASPQIEDGPQAYAGVAGTDHPMGYMLADGVHLQVGGYNHLIDPQAVLAGLQVTINNTEALRLDAAGLSVAGRPVPVPQPPITPTYAAWTTPQNTTYQTLRLIPDGVRVCLDGSASTTTAFTGSQTAFTVPPELCPKKDHYLGLVRATSADPRVIGCRIQASGTVTVYASTTVATTDTWDFTDISWTLI